jgi:hypothetical protein
LGLLSTKSKVLATDIALCDRGSRWAHAAGIAVR